MTELTIKQVVSKRILLRDKLKEIRSEFEQQESKIKAAEQACEAWLLQRAREVGVDQFKVAGVGTAFISTVTKVSCNDWPKLHEWVIKTKNIDALERRVSKTFVKEFREAHKELPPGVAAFDEQTINVRRSTKAENKETVND